MTLRSPSVPQPLITHRDLWADVLIIFIPQTQQETSHTIPTVTC